MLTKEAIEHLQETGIEPKDRIVEINNQKFVIDKNGEANKISHIQNNTLLVATLAGFVDTTKSILGKPDIGDHGLFAVHVVSATCVRFVSAYPLAETGVYETFVKANADDYISKFRFGHGYSPDDFNVALQTSFQNYRGPDLDKVLEASSKISAKSEIHTEDDGVSQCTTTGDVLNAKIKVTNPVRLSPFRTFHDLQLQPESLFVFRILDGPRCVLHEADSGKWKLDAILSIKEYLVKALPDGFKIYY